MNGSPRTDPTDEVGIWRAIRSLGGYRFSEVIWPELFFGALVGVGGAVAVVHSTGVAARVDVIQDLIAVAVALLAVVFTAIAIIVALPASRYLVELANSPDGGMRTFIEPFLVAVGTQVALVVLTVGYAFLATHVPAEVEHATFYVLGFLFVFGLLDIAGLARQLVRQGINRAADAAAEAADEREQSAQVHRLENRG